jgi:multicomponent Na+:H+ antiporter subunit F
VISVLDAVLLLLVAAMLVAIGRALWGPANADRVLALDLGFAVFIAGLAVLAVRLDAPALLDLVLAATLVGFLATVVFSYLVERRSG